MDASVSQEREPDILILLCTANYQHFKCVAAKRKSVNTDKHWQQPTIPHQPQYSREKITIFPGVHRTSLYAIRNNISTFIYYYNENLYRQQSALHNLSTSKPTAVKAVLNTCKICLSALEWSGKKVEGVRKAKNEAQLKQIKHKITALTANGWANRSQGGRIRSRDSDCRALCNYLNISQ